MFHNVHLVILLLLGKWNFAFSTQPISSIDWQAEFNWKFYTTISSNFTQNAAVAPFGVRKIFASLAAVLSPAGEGSTELANVLYLNSPSSPDPRVVQQQYRWNSRAELNMTTLAVGLSDTEFQQSLVQTWGQYNLYKKLLNRLTKDIAANINQQFYYLSKTTVKNFLAKNEANPNWDLFFLDSLKFKTRWMYSFREDQFTTCRFYVSNSEEPMLVPFMAVEQKMPFLQNKDLKAVQVPLESGSLFSILLLMPNDGKLSKLFQNFTHTKFKHVLENLRETKTLLKIPQITMRSKIRPLLVLRWMGLKQVLSSNKFKVFNNRPEVTVNDIIQKIEVKFENVGERSAASLPDRAVGSQFTANQPFAFVVFDRTSLTPLVIGHFVGPRMQSTELTESEPERCDYAPEWYTGEGVEYDEGDYW